VEVSRDAESSERSECRGYALRSEDSASRLTSRDASKSVPHREPRPDEVIIRRVVQPLARSYIVLEIVGEPGDRSRNWTACRPADPVFPIIPARYRNSPKRIVCGMKRADKRSCPVNLIQRKHTACPDRKSGRTKGDFS